MTLAWHIGQRKVDALGLRCNLDDEHEETLLDDTSVEYDVSSPELCDFIFDLLLDFFEDPKCFLEFRLWLNIVILLIL